MLSRIVGHRSQKLPSAGRRKDLSIGTLKNNYHSVLFPLQKSNLSFNSRKYIILFFVYIHRAKLFIQLLSASSYGNPLHPLLSLINEKSSNVKINWYTSVCSAPHGISKFSERRLSVKITTNHNSIFCPMQPRSCYRMSPSIIKR